MRPGQEVVGEQPSQLGHHRATQVGQGRQEANLVATEMLPSRASAKSSDCYCRQLLVQHVGDEVRALGEQHVESVVVGQ